MELFATVHIAFIASLLLSVFKLITCQDQVQTPGTVSVTEGETATIDCQFERSKLVALDWKKGEDVSSATSLVRLFRTRTIYGSDPRFNMTNDNSLTITGTTQADSGVYWCQVTLQGIFESSTNLTVLPVVTTTPAPTTAPTTTPLTEAATTKRKTTSGTASVVNTDIAQQVAESTSVTTTPEMEPSINTVKPTAKPEPKAQTSNNTTLYIIVGSCTGVVSLAILVLVCYCCCCKRKTPNGYSKPKPTPNTPV